MAASVAARAVRLVTMITTSDGHRPSLDLPESIEMTRTPSLTTATRP